MYYFYILKAFFLVLVISFVLIIQLEKGGICMDFLNAVKGINNVLWNYVLIFLLCGTGVLFTVSLKFVQVSKFKESFKKSFWRNEFKRKKSG